jgi:hypothetical protein
MKPRAQAVSELEGSGYKFARHGTNHDIYYNAKLGCMIPLKRHDFDEDDLRYILSEIKRNSNRR